MSSTLRPEVNVRRVEKRSLQASILVQTLGQFTIWNPIPTGYATSEPREGKSPEKRAKTAEMWLPERKPSLCRFWKEWKQGVSYGTVTPRWEKEVC